MLLPVSHYAHQEHNGKSSATCKVMPQEQGVPPRTEIRASPPPKLQITPLF